VVLSAPSVSICSTHALADLLLLGDGLGAEQQQVDETVRREQIETEDPAGKVGETGEPRR